MDPINDKSTAAAPMAADNDASLIPGREEAIKGLADELFPRTPPEAKVAAKPAELPANGEKPENALLNPKTEAEQAAEAEAKKAAGTAAAAEPKWTAEQTAWFEAVQAAKTPEEQAAAQAQAPEFTAEEIQWLESQAEGSGAKAEGAGDDHLADEPELKGKLDAATQERINKRIGKEVAKAKTAAEQLAAVTQEREALKAQLAARPGSPDAQTGPLGHVMDEPGLQRVVAEANQALDQSEDLLAQVEEDPAAVEATLKAAKVALKAPDGTDDYSVASMKKFLRGVKNEAGRVLRTEVPRRVEFLKQAEQYAAEAVALVPEIKDAQSPRRALFNDVLTRYPQIKAQAAWPRIAAVFVLGLEKYQEIQKAAKPGTQPVAKKKLPIPTKIPSPRGQAPAVAKPGKNEVSDAVVESALNGDKSARLKYLQTLVPKR